MMGTLRVPWGNAYIALEGERFAFLGGTEA